MKRQQLRTLVLLLLITSCLSVAVIIPIRASAQQLFPSIAPTCDQNIVKTVNETTGFTHYLTNKNCGFDDFIQLFINLFDWGLAILSILSIIFFIIGGTMLLVSAGKEQTITQGKAILANTFLGIVVALGGWLIINTVVGLLVGNGTFQNVKVFGENWWGSKASCTSTYKRACLHDNLQNGCGDVQSTYVQDLQTALNNAPGCSAVATLSTDGCFGNQTEAVVQKFNEAQSIGGSTAIKETWDALAAGKGCSGNGSAQQPDQTKVNPGCCVTQCGSNGIEGTDQTSCQSLNPNAVWYAGACKTDTAISTGGCCILIQSGLCIQDANKGWCNSPLVATGKPNGVYYPLSPCSTLCIQVPNDPVQKISQCH